VNTDVGAGVIVGIVVAGVVAVVIVGIVVAVVVAVVIVGIVVAGVVSDLQGMRCRYLCCQYVRYARTNSPEKIRL
jgi:hypothetical protein